MSGHRWFYFANLVPIGVPVNIPALQGEAGADDV